MPRGSQTTSATSQSINFQQPSSETTELPTSVNDGDAVASSSGGDANATENSSLPVTSSESQEAAEERAEHDAVLAVAAAHDANSPPAPVATSGSSTENGPASSEVTLPVGHAYYFIQVFDADNQVLRTVGSFFSKLEVNVKASIRKHLQWPLRRDFLMWKRVDGTTITDVYEARMVFEPACAGLLANRRTTQDLADLRATVEQLDSLLEDQIYIIGNFARNNHCVCRCEHNRPCRECFSEIFSRYLFLFCSVATVELVIHTLHPCYPPYPIVLHNLIGWSASLAFAPVRRNPPQKAKTQASRLPAGAVTSSALPQGAPATASAIISSTAVVFAPPSLVAPAQQPASTLPEAQAQSSQGWGKKVKPPSMVLDEDVNGFKTRRGGKKAGGAKGKGKKVRSIPFPTPHDPTSRVSSE